MIGTIAIAIPSERFLYRRIYAQSELVQVLMTIGVTFCIIGITNYIFGPTLKTIPLPGSLSGPVDIGFRTIAAHRLFVMVCGLAVALGLWLLIERTAFGIRLRAAVDNAAMASALGVRTEIVYAVAFAFAMGLAAFGGVVGAEFLPIEPYYALRYMVTFLVVVSVGGAGSISGALVACLLLGAVDTTGRLSDAGFRRFLLLPRRYHYRLRLPTRLPRTRPGSNVMIQTFVIPRGQAENERLDLHHTCNINTLVSLEIPKFATVGAETIGRTSESGH